MKHNFCMVVVLLLAISSGSLPVGAQEPTPTLEQLRTMSREERIKAHQRRIEQIIQENKRRQEEEARRAAAAQQQSQPLTSTSPSPTPVVPGAVPRGPVQAYIPSGVPGATPPPGQPQQQAAPSSARSMARSLVYFRPFDSIVKPGDTFLTQLTADTRDAVADEIQITLRYPPEALNLLAVDLAPIAPALTGEVEYGFEPDRGLFGLRAKLRAAEKFSDRPIAQLYWEALAPTDAAQIRFDFSGDLGTDIRYQGTSLLGTEGSRSDGAIHSNVVVKLPKSKNVVARVGANELLVGAVNAGVAAPTQRLKLIPSKAVVAENEQCYVDVVLDNPFGDPFDRVQLYLQFDPDRLEVLDVDRKNWIRSGTNIEDGFAHERFPFDFHKTNWVDNDRGLIVYEEGCEVKPLRASGTMARVHLRAKAGSRGTASVSLVRNVPGTLPTTNVSFLGQTVLADYPQHEAALDDVHLVVTADPNSAALTTPSSR